MRNRLRNCFHPPRDPKNYPDESFPEWPARAADRIRLAETTVVFIDVLERIYDYEWKVCAALDDLFVASVNALKAPEPFDVGGEG